MKDPLPIPVHEAIAQLERFDAILDARSPAEFAEDHLPGATSTPVLDDAQRARVGTIDRQHSSFEARRIGAALAARNIAALLEERLAHRPREWRPLVYCWRGGQRSGALAAVLASVGWRTTVLEGGYRAFRRQVLDDLGRWPAGLRLRVLAGRTGAAKTLVLRRLAAGGAQVLDLEAIAEHRGSVLGPMPGTTQPAQKRFETRLWQALRGFDPARTVLVESESRRIGRCHLPDALITAMREAPCVRLDAPPAVRAGLLLREYRHYTVDPVLLFERLERLAPLHGYRQVDAWKAMIRARDWQAFVESLLALHYDPAYDRSIERNYRRIDEAATVSLASDDEAALAAAARAVADAAREPVSGPAAAPAAPGR